MAAPRAVYESFRQLFVVDIQSARRVGALWALGSTPERFLEIAGAKWAHCGRIVGALGTHRCHSQRLRSVPNSGRPVGPSVELQSGFGQWANSERIVSALWVHRFRSETVQFMRIVGA